MKTGKGAGMRKYIVYGASLSGSIAWELLHREGKVIAFIDSDRSRWGERVHGITIHPPDALDSLDSQATLVIASHRYPEILHALSSRPLRHPVRVFYYEKAKGQILRRENSLLTRPLLPDTLQGIRIADGSLPSWLQSPRDYSPLPGRVLFIAYYFPPHGGGGVQRTTKFIKYLREFGWSPLVITSGPRNFLLSPDPSQLNELPIDLPVVRCEQQKLLADCLNQQDFQDCFSLWHCLTGDTESLEELRENCRRPGCLSRNELMLPDRMVHWACQVLKGVDEVMERYRPEAVVTSSFPYSAHLVGAVIRRRYGIPWIADFRDDWLGHAYFSPDKGDSPTRQKLDRTLEGLFLRESSHFLTVSEPIRQAMLSRHGLSMDRSSVIPNGYDEDDFRELPPRQVSDRFRIGFMGSMYRCIDPGIFVEEAYGLIDRGMVRPEEIGFRFLGSMEPAIRERIAAVDRLGLVEPVRYLPHRECLARMHETSLLTLITGAGETRKGVYTGKVFEYLRLGIPVLALTPPGSVVDILLQETGCGWNIAPDRREAIRERLHLQIEAWRKDLSGISPNPLAVSRYSRRFQTECLAKLLEGIRS